VHEHTDEFFLVLDGQFDVVLREAGGERTVSLRQVTCSSCRRTPSTSRPRPAGRS